MREITQEGTMVCAEVAALLEDMRLQLRSSGARYVSGSIEFDMDRLDRDRMVDALALVEKNFRPQIVHPPKQKLLTKSTRSFPWSKVRNV